MRLDFRPLVGFVVVALLAIGASGAEFHVATAEDLTSALQTAAENGEDDVIALAAGTYQGNFVYQLQDGNALVLEGAAGTTPDEVILDGGGEGSVFVVFTSSEGSVTIAGITVQNGNVERSYGGGIRIVGENGSLELSLRNVIIEGNSADFRGGGIGIRTYGNASIRVEIRDSIIRNNETPGFATGGQGRGGGIYAYAYRGASSIELLVVDSLVHGNRANWTGGGIELAASEVGEENTVHAVLINTTVTGNLADMNGQGYHPAGGIMLYGYAGEGARATLELYNSIVWGNTASEGEKGQDLFVGAADPAEAEVRAHYSDLGDVLVDESVGSPVYEAVETLSADPLFLDPGVGDFRLGGGSPCLDAGTADIPAPALPEFDISGDPRVCGPAPDIGAYERCED